MATKFFPQKKIITGTKKKDTIKWVNKKGWKSALTVNAGSGNDVINFKNSSYNKNKLFGQAGKDTIYGGKKNDSIDGGTGDDKLYGNAGNDTIKGGTGKDYIYGGAGTDRLYGGKGNDQINAGKGTNYIYHAKGDGNDTIVKGGGTDTLVFTGVSSISQLKAKASGNNVVITAPNGEKVTLKDYLKGGHSTKYVQVGKTKVKTEEIRNKITSAAEIVNGTAWGDEIYATHEYPSIYAGNGNDIIHITSDFTYSYLGKGNDTVSIETNDFVRASIYFENGDGNNTLKGTDIISDSTSYNYINLQSDSLIKEIKSITDNTRTMFSYIAAERSNDNLVLNLTGGETFTIENYYNFTQNQRERFYVNDYEFYFESIYYTPDKIETVADNINIFTSTDERKIILAQRLMGGNRTINLNGNNEHLILEGDWQQCVTISADNCSAYINNTGDTNNNLSQNVVNISGNYNYIKMSGGYNHRTFMDDNLNYNNIYIYGGTNNYINTSNGGKTYVTLDSDGPNTIASKGIYDEFDIFNGGDTNINFAANSEARKYIAPCGNSISHINVNGATGVKLTTLDIGVTSNPVDVMFSHYYNADANATKNGDDYISFHVQKEDGTIFYDVSDINIYGKWTNGTFNLDTEAMKTKINARAYYYDEEDNFNDIDYKDYGDMTQLVDMNSDKIAQNTYGGNTHKLYTMGDDILNVAKDVYVQGTNSYDDYGLENIDTIGKKHTISDAGGEDWLTINQEASEGDFRFYFDVILGDNNTYTLGNDLYVISTAGSDYTDTDLYKLFKGEDVNYLCIKDFFGNDNGVLGTGCIETIEDATGAQADYEAIAGAIGYDVAAWLRGTEYSSVSQIIETGGTTSQAQALFGKYFDETTWNGLW